MSQHDFSARIRPKGSASDPAIPRQKAHFPNGTTFAPYSAVQRDFPKRSLDTKILPVVPRPKTKARLKTLPKDTEIHTRVKDHEWQMLQAFIGYLDRHLGSEVDSISVHYR